MRAFLTILGLIALSLLIAAVLAYPTWRLVELIDDQPIHRVMHRVAMLCVLIGLVWIFRRWRLTDRKAFGFGLSRNEFWLQMIGGVVSGALIILPMLSVLQLLEVRVADPRVQVTAALIATVVAKGLLTGFVVSLIEEIFFRALLFTAVERDSGRFAAIALTSLLYASVHFLGGRLHVPADQLGWDAGFQVIGRMFIAYADPAALVDSFAALFSVGVLLALVRVRTGSVAACIGLHTAWVCALYYFEVTTQFNSASKASWMVGTYDNFVGWATVAWMGVMAVIYVAVARTTRSPLTRAAR